MFGLKVQIGAKDICCDNLITGIILITYHHSNGKDTYLNLCLKELIGTSEILVENNCILIKLDFQK